MEWWMTAYAVAGALTLLLALVLGHAFFGTTEEEDCEDEAWGGKVAPPTSRGCGVFYILGMCLLVWALWWVVWLAIGRAISSGWGQRVAPAGTSPA